MNKVFISRRLPNIARELLSEEFKVSYNNENKPLEKKKLYDLVENYDAILSTVSDKFTKDILQCKGKLKVISNYGTGIDNIDKNFAEIKGISVYNTPDIVTNSTADLTVSIFLALIRKIIPAQKFVIENKLLFPEGSVIKYILRHQDKGGKEDLEKAKHFIDMIIERDYRDEKEKKESWLKMLPN